MDDNRNDLSQIQITPVGKVRSNIKTPMLLTNESDIELQERNEKFREHHEKTKHSISELVIFPQWEALLDGIDGFSHVLVLYWPHLIKAESRRLRKVHPKSKTIDDVWKQKGNALLYLNGHRKN